MATLQEKIKAERAGRAMLERGGLPQPDHVEYGYTCIRFLWDEQKVALVIEIDKPPEGFDVIGKYLSGPEEVGEYRSDSEDEAA